MNKHAKNELVFLMGLGALAALFLKQKKVSAGLGIGAAALALSQIKKPESFRGKVVVVTGGSRGLGLAIAQRFAIEGARIVLIAREFKELERAKHSLEMHVPADQILIAPCDITDDEELSSTFVTTIRKWGQIDVLVNNAGAIIVGPFESMSMEDFEAQMKLHLYANIRATQKVLPHFRRNGGGRIINICSMGGKVAVPHMLPYDTSKFALAGFSQGITAELSKENISVTTVYPTLLRTGSPIQAVFKGDAKKEFSWFANADVMPGLSLDPSVAAEKIVEASRERRSELIPSFIGRLRMVVGTVLPELMLVTMGIVNQLMPKGKNKTYKTGAQCLTDDTYLTKGLKQASRHAEESWNQKQKGDPEFNLGLH